MNNHKFMLAQKWNEQDPTGWYMSEKLDGVRALWTGHEFVSRLGNVFNAPKCFTDKMPNAVLDGELYGGRGTFQTTVGIVKHKVPDEQAWMGLTYNIFDAPTVSLPFRINAAGLQEVKEHYSEAPIVVAIQTPCQGLDHLQSMLSDVCLGGGEGLMLRHPESYYEGKRSKNLLKVKVFKNNKALVLSHVPGLGKHEGRLGALECCWNGVKFFVGTGFSDDEREHPPEPGSYIRFSYFELTRDGIPRFPVYLGKET